MAVFRTRFLLWLIKAYVRKWGRQFVLFFVVGLFIFFLLIRFYPYIITYIPVQNKTVIGARGAYAADEIPDYIISRVGNGLTKITKSGEVVSDLASSWEIKDNGRTYIFRLNKNIKFNDGTRLTSKNVTYSFKDVSIARPDDSTIIFKLKDEYAPFLVTVSKPIFLNGYIGTGDYIINNIELNGNFIKSVQLVSKENRFKSEEYIFYPTTESLKIAFALGEITEIESIPDMNLHKTSLESFPNLVVEKKPNLTKLVTLFFNTEDPLLSDKKWRSGLTYALPSNFKEGIRVYTPYSPSSFFFNDTLIDKSQDLNHAKVLIDSAMETASNEAKPTLSLKVLKKYKQTASIVKNSWSKVGVNISITEVDSIPDTFQIYLGDFNVPKDPDQYSLWHSNQSNNITRFKNLRIDKLLEDGRRNTDPSERLRIYTDFQKYLVDESPAAFLYFPIEYSLKRK